MNRKTNIAITAALTAGAFLVGNRIPPIGDLVSQLLEPPTKITANAGQALESSAETSADPSSVPQETNQMRAIIMNGFGEESRFYSEKGQKDSAEAALVAYDDLSLNLGKENVHLFLCNPYNLPVPENVQVFPATKKGFLTTLVDDASRQGILYLVLLNPPSKKLILGSGIAENTSNQIVHLEDGNLSVHDIRDVLLSGDKMNYRKIILMGTMDDTRFLDGLFDARSDLYPRDLLAILFNFYDTHGESSLIRMFQACNKDPEQSIRQLIDSYLARGISANENGLKMGLEQDPYFNRPFLYGRKKGRSLDSNL